MDEKNQPNKKRKNNPVVEMFGVPRKKRTGETEDDRLFADLGPRLSIFDDLENDANAVGFYPPNKQPQQKDDDLLFSHVHRIDVETDDKRKFYTDKKNGPAPPPKYFIRRNQLADKTWDAVMTKANAPATSAASDIALPNELLEYIFSFLAGQSTHDVMSASFVCARWFTVARPVLNTSLRTYPADHFVHLTREQRIPFEKATNERFSICIFGEAGTGKSRVLRAIDTFFLENGLNSHVVAPTGLAATLVNGMTIHEFMGHGINQKSEYELDELVGRPNPIKAIERARATDVLIIDEISMVTSKLFEYIDLVMRCFRRKKEIPFGGVQVICLGDFAQLPPVVKKNESALYYQKSQHVFDSKIFERLFGNPLEVDNPYILCLSKPMRQSRDPMFLEMLRSFRSDMPSQYSKELLEKRHEKALIARGERFGPAMMAVPHRETANIINSNSLQAIKELAISYNAIASSDGYFGIEEPDSHDKMLEFLNARNEYLKPTCVKKTARVSLSCNILAHGLCNKMTGTIVRMVDLETEPDDVETIANNRVDPKSILAGYNDKAEFFVVGDNSVGLCMDSRRSVTDRRIYPWRLVKRAQPLNEQSRRCTCSGIEDEIFGRNQSRKLPLVEFDSRPNKFYLLLPCTRDYYVRDGEDPKDPKISLWRVAVSVTKMPLDLAYAQTFHGLQGLTLDKIKLALEDCWQSEQVYVGLSRVHSLSELCVTSMPRWNVLYGHRNACSTKAIFQKVLEAKVWNAALSEKRAKKEERKKVATLENRQKLKRKAPKPPPHQPVPSSSPTPCVNHPVVVEDDDALITGVAKQKKRKIA